jgi:hypothetical protein
MRIRGRVGVPVRFVFKGLERPAVVLAVKGFRDEERAREMLYVGLSRARDLLVVCGDLELIRRVGGDAVAHRLTASPPRAWSRACDRWIDRRAARARRRLRVILDHRGVGVVDRAAEWLTRGPRGGTLGSRKGLFPPSPLRPR